MTDSTTSQKPSYATEGASSRARFVTDADGRFFFRTIVPCSYPIPTDGPVGQMITQTNRHPMRSGACAFPGQRQGHEPLITHVFIEGDEYIDSDVVFGGKDELIAKVERRTRSRDARWPAFGRTVELDELRIPREARRRHGARAARHQGHRRRLTLSSETDFARSLRGAQELC